MKLFLSGCLDITEWSVKLSQKPVCQFYFAASQNWVINLIGLRARHIISYHVMFLLFYTKRIGWNCNVKLMDDSTSMVCNQSNAVYMCVLVTNPVSCPLHCTQLLRVVLPSKSTVTCTCSQKNTLNSSGWLSPRGAHICVCDMCLLAGLCFRINVFVYWVSHYVYCLLWLCRCWCY